MSNVAAPNGNARASDAANTAARSERRNMSTLASTPTALLAGKRRPVPHPTSNNARPAVGMAHLSTTTFSRKLIAVSGS
jgi:hypothetical protein